MSNSIFVDTLFVTALINSRDQYHQQAFQLPDLFENQPLLVTDAVLLEIGNALARSHKADAVKIIERFFASEEVEVVSLTPQLFERAFNMYKTHQDKSWGLVDCISFVVMREAGVSRVLTIDRHFTQAGFQILMRRDRCRADVAARLAKYPPGPSRAALADRLGAHCAPPRL
ncbi:MAG: type II toxin-antitoxin system VapC family toxin [Chloroflexia bacterium]